MIVFREDKEDPLNSPPPRHSNPVPLGAREANRAADAVLLGDLNIVQASSRYGVAIPLLEAWLRARVTAGLVPHSAGKA